MQVSRVEVGVEVGVEVVVVTRGLLVSEEVVEISLYPLPAVLATR
jgi:hypothetical protein